MKRIFVAAAVAVSLATPAFAADMPAKAPVPPPVIANWTGFYVGLNAGGGWGNTDPSMTTQFTTIAGGFFLPATAAAVNANGSPGLDTTTFIGGIQAGYNLQTGNIVWGIEADFNYMRADASHNVTVTIPGITFNLRQSVETDWLFTARPRLGYAMNNWLVYVTGGLAVTNLKYDAAYSDSFGNVSTSSVSDTKAGWTIGGGLEYLWQRNWSAKIEYLYADFGDVSAIGVPNAAFNANCGAGTGCANPFNNSADLKMNIVRAGVNYRF